MQIELIKCFIASPSDTQQERNICAAVFDKINTTLGKELNFRVESRMWEKDASPGFGKDAQDVVNKYILNDYQLFVGIMYNRFGTETNRAGSGTEEEFNHAYQKHVNQEDIEIMFYFNNEAAVSKDLDLIQVKKVRDFRERVVELGGLFCEYDGHIQFEKELEKHLNNFFIKKFGARSSDDSIQEKSIRLKEIAFKESVSIILNNRFNDSLCMFSNQPIVWVDPILSTTNEISKNAKENYDTRINLQQFISTPKSTIIKSPPQFGLSSLANYMIKEAWNELDKVWVLFDFKLHKKNSVKKSLTKELEKLRLSGRKIDCIVVDSWSVSDIGALKLINNLCEEFKDTPIIIMQTIDDSNFINEKNAERITRDFEVFHLLALPRNQIRKVVSAYNTEIPIGEENTLLDKLLLDMDTLNIHRTPLNCLTLLKVSEKYFDESPVNRTRMLEMVLFVLFDLGDIPTYKNKPDLKDCEYVLGRFCEILLKEK